MSIQILLSFPFKSQYSSLILLWIYVTVDMTIAARPRVFQGGFGSGWNLIGERKLDIITWTGKIWRGALNLT